MKKVLFVVSVAVLLMGCNKSEQDAGSPGKADSVYGGTTGGTLSTNAPGSLPGQTNVTGSPKGATGGNTPGGAPKSPTP